MQSWAAALPSTLTQPVVAQLWNDNAATITTTSGVAFLTLSGHVTSASNNVTITAAAGESFRNATTPDPFTPDFSSVFGASPPPLTFSASAGVSFTLPATGSGSINYIQINDDNVIMDGLQFQDPNPGSNSNIILATQNVRFQNGILDGYSQTGGANIIGGVLSGASTCTFTITNSLIVERSTSPGTGAKTWSTDYTAISANNTFIALNNPTSLVGYANDGVSGTTSRFTNTIMLGYAAATVLLTANAGASVTVDHSLFSAGSLTGGGVTTGSGNLFSKVASNQFVDASANFRLQLGADAINAGTTDTTDIPSSTDVYGTTRPQGSAWDIGANEFIILANVGSFSGTSSLTGVGLTVKRSIGTFVGSSTLSGVSLVGPSGTFAGSSTLVGISASVKSSVGTFSGSSSFIGVNLVNSLTATLEIDHIPPQATSTPFEVHGSYTLFPSLQYSDDGSAVFTSIPISGISALGTSPFEFTHPGMPAGQQVLFVEDTSTGGSAATTYVVDETPIFPPSGPTGTKAIIPAYLYQEYNDDEDCQAFVDAYNLMAQQYLDWFNTINLPVYTGLSGSLLDWVAEGLYGMRRPNVAFTQVQGIGAFNTYTLNFIPFDGTKNLTTSTVYQVTDDIFKRILTWSFYKGDGKQFTISWLKRRVMRFLGGLNGVDPGVDQTYQVSVSFHDSSTVNITVSGGIIPLTYAQLMRAALISGVLPLPFQYTYNILIGS